ncbi:hypothetical protein HDU67_000059 [Dinochytrium kinnereticum]|nr:hypothetical protein HDU67_000059 [Dinochytrium kinnereticum]
MRSFTALLATALVASAAAVAAAPAPAQSRPFVIADVLNEEDVLRSISEESNPTPPDHTVLFLVEHLESARELSKLLKEVPDIKNFLNETAAVTLFAPTNEAFRRKPNISPSGPGITDIAASRVSTSLKNGDLIDTMLVLDSLGGQAQKIKVVKADIKGTNGYVHTVDRILLPPPHVGRTLYSRPQDFSVLVLALKRAELIDQLTSSVAITIFAPVNRAFRKLGFRRLRYLFSDEGANELKQILAYHVSTDLVYSGAIVQAGSATLPTLLDGETLQLQIRKEEDEQGHKNTVIEINDQAHVVFNDILSSNAAVHGIDHVLTPPGFVEEVHDCHEEFDDDDFAHVMEALL